MASAPVLFVPAPLRGIPDRFVANKFFEARIPRVPFADVRFVPHYPEKSPLDAILRFAEPGTDEYVTEGYSAQIASQLAAWGDELRSGRRLSALRNLVANSIEFHSLTAPRETLIRSRGGIDVLRREFSSLSMTGRDRFVEEMSNYFAGLKSVNTIDFEIYSCRQTATSPVTLSVEIRYEVAGSKANDARESRTGNWSTRWIRDESGNWKASQWKALGETFCRAPQPLFIDITERVLGGTESYKDQLLHGADYWRTVLDGAIGVDVYGNNGVAIGDFDHDGLDDLYICQAAGLPNHLFRNRGDGTLEDVTEKSGVGVLDFTSCALFADFENRGVQDLLVVGATGPLLFVNDGKGKFALKKDAFHFARAAQGTFTHAALADYNRDGRLDVYFCLYNYYQGLDQYRYPVPYFDARNGPPNYLFRNSGSWKFEDVTEEAGLNIDNDRYTFACSWGDVSGDGWPDLYVVNDFGRNVLYRNKGNGTFEVVSQEARVNEVGAGMSSCWLDFDNDGRQDIYAAGMWVPAGMRVFEDSHFHPADPEDIRALYQHHMKGNSLYRNLGNGKFENVGTQCGVEKGRWSWSTDAWDFDNDGYSDLYVANGYISGLEKQQDVSSFFWRQVVAKSPQTSNPSPDYERGWGAMNELIRSDSTWNGNERNVFLANNGDGTFSDISGIAGLDFRDDSRAFALADLDGDGKLEIVLKNRNAPQVRILRNTMARTGNSIVLRLRGEQSNRDAIGAAVTVSSGSMQQTKYVQAGSGFLSQHTKELFFGLGDQPGEIKATIHWPGGMTQDLQNLPINQRIEVHEGNADFRARPYTASPKSWAGSESFPTGEILPSVWGTWLIEPVAAPAFSLLDLNGNLHELGSQHGKFVLLVLWITTSIACRESLDVLRKSHAALSVKELQILALSLDDSQDSHAIQSFAGTLPFPVLLGSSEVAGVYNIVYRYLFDRHRDLSFPMEWLIDPTGAIVKIYHGRPNPEEILGDIASLPHDGPERLTKALPFAGTLFQDEFRRNAHTYGVAFFQHGFLKEAEEAFQRAVSANSEDADAFYNLGTLYLRRNSPDEAKHNLKQAVKLRPSYAEAWNNLGMLAAQQGNYAEAISNFQRSLELRPNYATGLLNLGNVYRKQGDFGEAETFLKRAYEIDPANAEINYNLGMLYARKKDMPLAEQYLKSALKLRPDYSDALNNLAVLLIQQQRYSEAEANLNACIQAAPGFDQAYLNLARMYVVLNEKAKARTTLEALLQKQPEHKMAQQMLQLLY